MVNNLVTQKKHLMKLVKVVFAVAFTFMLMSMACNKNDNKKLKTNASLIGTWELRESSAAMNPTVSKFPVGNGNLVIFTDNTYEFRRDGQIVKSGKYKVVADSSVEQNVCLIFQKGEYAQRVSFDGNVEPKRFFQIFGNKLSFVSGCYAVDAGHKEEYEKVIND